MIAAHHLSELSGYDSFNFEMVYSGELVEPGGGGGGAKRGRREGGRGGGRERGGGEGREVGGKRGRGEGGGGGKGSPEQQSALTEISSMSHIFLRG